MDYLIEGAPIYTLDSTGTIAEALLVRDGFVLAAGSRKDIGPLSPKARKIDLAGGAVIPAFNDCHAHVLRRGLDMNRAELRNCRSVEEIGAAMRSWKQSNPDSEWLAGVNYDQNRLLEKRHITLDELDAIGAGQPVYLFHISRHEGLANSRAMKLAGITADTPDPPEGHILRDDSGHPTGRLQEMAVSLVENAMPHPTPNQLVQAASSACALLASRGVLAATEATYGKWHGLKEEWRAFDAAIRNGPEIRMTLMPEVEACEKEGWIDRDRVELPVADPNLRLGAMKIISDGALSNRTASVNEPYADDGGHGILVYPPEKLKEKIVRAHLGGWSCAVHAIGDRAIGLCLDGFEEADRRQPRAGSGHRIEHCMMVDPDINRRMSDLGIIPCAQPEFIWGLGHAYRACLGEAANELMPYKTWLKYGLEPAFGSDMPIVSGDPIIGWRAAVDRKDRQGEELGPHEGLDPISALKAYTVGSALASADDRMGSLSPGKLARFVVLNLLPSEILNPEMKIVTTSLELM